MYGACQALGPPLAISEADASEETTTHPVSASLLEATAAASELLRDGEHAELSAQLEQLCSVRRGVVASSRPPAVTLSKMRPA